MADPTPDPSPIAPGKTLPVPCPNCAHVGGIITRTFLDATTYAPMMEVTCQGCQHVTCLRLVSMQVRPGAIDPADAGTAEAAQELRFDKPVDPLLAWWRDEATKPWPKAPDA